MIISRLQVELRSLFVLVGTVLPTASRKTDALRIVMMTENTHIMMFLLQE